MHISELSTREDASGGSFYLWAAFGMEVLEFVAGVTDEVRGFAKEARRALARSFAKEHGPSFRRYGKAPRNIAA